MKNLPVIMCIGTDIVGGDCLGPIVGQLLIKSGIPAYVYGTLSRPITASNLNEYYEFIRSNHLSTIIAVDACVGKDVGQVSVTKGSLRPGAAAGKDLPEVGDVSVTAVTCEYPPSDRRFASVRLGFILSLARKVVETVWELVNRQ